MFKSPSAQQSPPFKISLKDSYLAKDDSDDDYKSQDDDEQPSHAFGKYTRGSGFISDALKKVGSVLGSIGKPIFESMPALKPFEGLLGENSLYSQVGNLAESAGLGSYPTQKRGLVNDYDRQERILKTIYKESKQRAIQALINEELLNQQLSKQEISDKQAGYYQLAYAKLMKELRDLNDEYRQNA